LERRKREREGEKGREREREREKGRERGVHLSTDIDVQRRGVGWRTYRLLGKVRRWTPRLWAVLRWRLISHAGSTHVPVIGNLLAGRPGGRADPGAIPVSCIGEIYELQEIRRKSHGAASETRTKSKRREYAVFRQAITQL